MFVGKTPVPVSRCTLKISLIMTVIFSLILPNFPIDRSRKIVMLRLLVLLSKVACRLRWVRSIVGKILAGVAHLSHCHFDHCESHVDWPRSKAAPREKSLLYTGLYRLPSYLVENIVCFH